MSPQDYLDAICAKTGVGPDELKALVEQKRLIGTKAVPVIAWLKADYGLGQGHTTAI